MISQIYYIINFLHVIFQKNLIFIKLKHLVKVNLT